MRLFANARYDFIGLRRTTYILSAAAIALGIAAALYWQITRGSWLAYGVDFTGGTLVQVRFEQPAAVGQLRALFPDAEITRFGAEHEYLIRAPQFAERGTEVARVIAARLAERFGAGTFDIVRTEAVGPKVGGELQRKATLAVLLSFAATLIYLAFRFEWRFGVAAVIATAHDILITLALISGLQLEVSLTTVAAVLTIVGYSLNDTIVVFDRIRENLRRTGRREAYIDILNRSINETLPRTVLTGGTTLATLVSLLVFGGEIIRDFAFILIVGILVGTYSSIFVASPALLEIEKRWGEKTKVRRLRPARPGVAV